VITAETNRRQAPGDANSETYLFQFLTNCEQSHAEAATAISALNRRGVDPHVLAYADKVHKWHDEGAVLFQYASRLLTDAPTSQLSGPFAQSWRSKATQYRMEERMLREKHAAVATYLEHAQMQTTPVPANDAAAAL
ncbi:MAG: hypothetical protein KDA61_20305, partial [Planctomycetales bacterium]|nr:hypothetical protein [Planctomycetales bacterium]